MHTFISVLQCLEDKWQGYGHVCILLPNAYVISVCINGITCLITD